MSIQPKPDSKKYNDLISEINKGEIKIPKFQRDFVWSLDKTASLLDSILKGYPIGTFILWETKQRLNDIKNIGNLSLAPVPEDIKIQYVLDGQQRITSLYAAYLGAQITKAGEKKVTNYSNIYVNLDLNLNDNEDAIITHEKPEESNFISLSDVLHFNERFIEIKNNYDDDLITKINKYHNIFQSYDFSTVVLRKDDIDSAIEVFTRINTGGQTLTLFEIMSAKTYDEERGFDMQKNYDDLIKELSAVQYETVFSSILLFIVSVIISKNGECKRRVILSLDKNEIIDVWDEVIECLKESIQYFKSVYKIPLSSLLPYDSLLVPFSYFFYRNNKERPQGNQIKYLEEFFWRASLSQRYSSATESKLAQDIKRINLIIDNQRPEYKDFNIQITPQNLVEYQFSAGNSFCKAILCLLCYEEPKDFLDNGKVNLDNNYLRRAYSKNYHHFFPKSFLKKNFIGNENSLMNITLVSDKLNKKKIGSKAPSDYIEEFSNSNELLEETLKTHLIEGIDKFGISSDDYSLFVKERAKLINRKLESRLNLKNELKANNNNLKELILKGESSKLEFKSTLRFDMINRQVNKKLEIVVAKTIAGFLNTNG